MVVKDSELGLWKFSHASVLDYFKEKNELWFRNHSAEVTLFMFNQMMKCLSRGLLWNEDSETYEGPPTSELSRSNGFATTEHLTWPPQHIMKNKSVQAISDWFESGAAVTDDTLDPRHPLQSYIQQNCFHHARDFSNEEAKTTGIYETLIRFFGEKGPQHSSREYRVLCNKVMLYEHGVYHRVYHAVLPRTNSIFGIIALGLHKTLDGWWNRDFDIPSLLNEGGRKLTHDRCLVWASRSLSISYR